MYDNLEFRLSEKTTTRDDLLRLLYEVKELLFSVFNDQNKEADHLIAESRRVRGEAAISSIETQKILKKYDLG